MGGATVFPHMDVGVWPEKGTAVFWDNLHSSGIADTRTLHTACPVLLGSKWGMLCDEINDINNYLHSVYLIVDKNI